MNLSSSSLITSNNQVRSKSHTLFPDKELIHLVKSGMNIKIRKKLKYCKFINLNQLTTCTIHRECLLIEKDHMEIYIRILIIKTQTIMWISTSLALQRILIKEAQRDLPLLGHIFVRILKKYIQNNDKSTSKFIDKRKNSNRYLIS